MATHRAHNLLHANPGLWLGEIKRSDSRLPTRLLLLKGIKESPQQCSVIGVPVPAQKMQRHSDVAIRLPLPLIPTMYPSPVSTVLKFTAPTGYRGAAVPKLESTPPESSEGPGSDKPSADKLLHVYNSLQLNLPRVFTHTMDYTIYSQDVVLVNNVLNKTTHGLFKYVQQVALLRLAGHLKFAYVRLEVVTMSQHPIEGRITVKWRVVGISGLRVMLKFWKFKVWRWEEMMKQQEVWYDVISHFDVGPDGLVFKHTVDRMEEDKEEVEVRKGSKSPLIAKLALIAALFPREEWGEALSFESILQSTTTPTPATAPLPKCQSQSHPDLL